MTDTKKLTVFQQALLDSVLSEYMSIPEEKDLQHEFSAEFQQWASEFVHTRTVRRIRFRSVVRKVLMAAIIAMLLAGTAMAIPAVREALIDFFTVDYSERIGITFDPEEAATAPAVIEISYSVAGVPERFITIAEENSTFCVTEMWIDELGQLIVFVQYPISQYPDVDSWIGLDASENTKQTVLMGDYLVEIIATEENKKLIWTNNEYFFTLELPNTITEEEMNSIFASWGPKA